MTVRQNNWTLGAYCAQYCRVVTVHRGLEDRGVFPHLREVPGAAPVIDRLEVEHEVIAELLEHVDGALVALVSQGRVVDPLRDVVERLAHALLSHLSYEERELSILALRGFPSQRGFP